MVSEQVIYSQYELAKIKFPKLRQPTLVDEVWIIDGSIDVIDDEGHCWDSFDVKITVPADYPDRLFELEETGGRIPKTPDWHNSNSCCLSTTATMFYEMTTDLTLTNWLEKFAHLFLANSLYKLKTGHYANEEFEHGTPGIIQGYSKFFKTNDASAIVEKLELITGGRTLERNAKCFCDSGQKYKKCFLMDSKSHHMGIPISVLKTDLAEIVSHLRNKK